MECGRSQRGSGKCRARKDNTRARSVWQREASKFSKILSTELLTLPFSKPPPFPRRIAAKEVAREAPSIVCRLVSAVRRLRYPSSSSGQNDSCGFVVEGNSSRPTVTGPDDIAPLVYVVDQPDSPIEIVSVDLSGMWLSVANEQHTERDCASYRVRKRSNRAIRSFEVLLQVGGSQGGGGIGARPSSPLGPGQTVEIESCGGGGHGGAPEK